MRRWILKWNASRSSRALLPHRSLHGQFHQEEPSGLNEGIPEPLHQPHSERPVCRLHAGRRPHHEEASACPSCHAGRMCACKTGRLQFACARTHAGAFHLWLWPRCLLSREEIIQSWLSFCLPNMSMCWLWGFALFSTSCTATTWSTSPVRACLHVFYCEKLTHTVTVVQHWGD